MHYLVVIYSHYSRWKYRCILRVACQLQQLYRMRMSKRLLNQLKLDQRDLKAIANERDVLLLRLREMENEWALEKKSLLEKQTLNGDAKEAMVLSVKEEAESKIEAMAHAMQVMKKEHELQIHELLKEKQEMQTVMEALRLQVQGAVSLTDGKSSTGCSSDSCVGEKNDVTLKESESCNNANVVAVSQVEACASFSACNVNSSPCFNSDDSTRTADTNLLLVRADLARYKKLVTELEEKLLLAVSNGSAEIVQPGDVLGVKHDCALCDVRSKDDTKGISVGNDNCLSDRGTENNRNPFVENRVVTKVDSASDSAMIEDSDVDSDDSLGAKPFGAFGRSRRGEFVPMINEEDAVFHPYVVVDHSSAIVVCVPFSNEQGTKHIYVSTAVASETDAEKFAEKGFGFVDASNYVEKTAGSSHIPEKSTIAKLFPPIDDCKNTRGHSNSSASMLSFTTACSGSSTLVGENSSILSKSGSTLTISSHLKSPSMDSRNRRTSSSLSNGRRKESIINIELREYMGIFFDALEEGDLSTVQVLLAEHPRLVRCRTENEESALHISCRLGLVEIAELLIRYNTDCNDADINETSCLHVCSSHIIGEMLIHEGADVNVHNNLGLTPLHFHVMHNNLEMVQLLLAHNASCNVVDYKMNITPLHLAAEKGNFLLVTALVNDDNTHIDVNAIDKDCETALHRLTFINGNSNKEMAGSGVNKNTDVVKCIAYLLHHGADPTITNARLITPLHYICGNDYLLGFGVGEQIVELLLEFHANPNAEDMDGCTPVIIACMHREFGLCVQIMAAGGDMNIPCPMDCYLLSKGYRRDVVNGMKKSVKDCTMSDLLPKPPRLRVFSAICSLQTEIPDDSRDRCMNCGSSFTGFFVGLISGKHHCRHCRRLLCSECCHAELPRSCFPDFVLDVYSESTLKACVVCEKVLIARADAEGILINAVFPDDDTFGRGSF